MFDSIKRLYLRAILRLQRRGTVKDGTVAEKRYTTGEHCSYNSPSQEGSTKSFSKILPGSRRRKRQQANSPGILRPGKPLPTPHAAVVLSDEDIALPCSNMTVQQLRSKLASLGGDPISRVPVDEEGGVIEEMEFEAMNYEAIHKEEMPEELVQERGYAEDAKLTEEQVVERWLRMFIDGSYTFNVAYAWVCAGGWRASGRRPAYWHSSLCQAAGNPQAERHVKMIGEGRGTAHRSIENPIGTWPRRIWDVCANRVIPFEWIAAGGAGDFWAISHAWTNDMQPSWTDANQRQWPVPLPKGVLLEDIRKELLGMNARYCWLDVLCLRQVNPEDPEAEKVRLNEWELDVPTIGIVYVHARRIVTYFNGLGRKFDLQRLKENSESHWINRIWTIQETVATQDMIIAGLPEGSHKPLDADIGNNIQLGTYINSIASILGRTLPVDSDIPYELMDPEVQDIHLRTFRINGSIQLDSNTFPKMLLEINRRYASNPVDKIAALMYLFLNGIHARSLPIYIPSEAPATAWERFIKSTARFGQHPTRYALALLDIFPHPSSRHWFPSWDQVTNYPDVSVTDPQEEGILTEGSPLYPPATRLGCGRLVRNCTLTWNRFTGADEAGRYTYTLSSPYYETTTVWVSSDAFKDGPTQIPDGTYTAYIPYDHEVEHGALPWIALCREVGKAEIIEDSRADNIPGVSGYISTEEDEEQWVDQYPAMRIFLRRITTVRWDHEGENLLLKRVFDLGDAEGSPSKHEVWLY